MPLSRMAAACLLAVPLFAGCGTTPVEPAPEPAVAGADPSGDVLTMSGRVDGIDNGCFADGVCSVTVEGLKVVTMRGWSQSTWGPRDADLMPGDRVDVRCRATDNGCTLEGSNGYFVRKAR